MNIRIIIFSLCLLSVNLIFAQDKKHYIKFRQSDPDLKIQLPIRTFFIERIIDGRTGDTSRIGTVHKGLANKPHEALMENGLLWSFTNLLEMNNLTMKTDKKQEPIMLEIKSLGISESITTSTVIGRMEMEVSFYRKINDTLRNIYRTELVEESKGMGITGSHGIRIKRGLHRGLFGLQDRLSDPNAPSFYSEADAEFLKNIKEYGLTMQEYSDTSSKAIIPLNRPRKYGIYLSFKDYQRNQPKIIGNFNREYEPDKSSLSIFQASKPKLLKGRFWGFYDEGRTYVYNNNYSTERRFVLVPEMGTLMIWKDRVLDGGEALRNAVYSGVAGGFVGAIALSGTGKGDFDCVIFDTRTGAFRIMRPKDVEFLLMNDKELLDKYNLSENKKDANTIMDIMKAYSLKYPNN